MKTLRGPAAYLDIVPALNAAMDNGGARVQCGTEGAAIKTVQRMNQFRILHRKMKMKEKHERPLPEDIAGREIEQENRDKLFYLASPYDDLIIKRIGSVAILEKRPQHPWVNVTDLQGNPITITPLKVYDVIEERKIEEWNKKLDLEIKETGGNGIDNDKPLGLMDEE